jgi:hypothetical protein
MTKIMNGQEDDISEWTLVNFWRGNMELKRNPRHAKRFWAASRTIILPLLLGGDLMLASWVKQSFFRVFLQTPK